MSEEITINDVLTLRDLEKELDVLQAENERLKEENSKIVWDEVCTTNCSKYKAYNKCRKALEEIRIYLNTLSTLDNDFPNTETYLRIQDKISEVLDERN